MTLFPAGRYDTKSALKRNLAYQASGGTGRTTVFPDATTRYQAYSVLSLTKRPGKWLERTYFRTLRHDIRPTAFSRLPSVRGNGPDDRISGRYDTKSGLQRTLAYQASGEMAPWNSSGGTKKSGLDSRFFLYLRWESNPNLKFRKLPFYPLNYRGGTDLMNSGAKILHFC